MTALDEVAGDGEVDVGVEQGLADLLHGLADVGLGDAAAAAQLLERFAETALDAFKHSFTPPLPRAGGARRSRHGEQRVRNAANRKL